MSPLHAAVNQGHVETARLLLVAGADINARTSGGERVLSLAWGSGKEPMRELLRKYGATK